MQSASVLPALLGGILIGTAATMLLWMTGRVAGISGIVRGLMSPSRGETLWRALFIAGLIGGAGAIYAIAGNAPVARAHFPPALIAAGGLLVGFGASLGSGCTSGHGVCGLGLLSSRSLTATITFLVIAIGTTFVVRHLFGVS